MLITFDLDDTLIETTASLTPFLLGKALERMAKKGLVLNDFNSDYRRLLQLRQKMVSSKEALSAFLENRKGKEKFLEEGLYALYVDLPEDAPILPKKDINKLLKELSLFATLVLVSFGNRQRQLNKMEKAGIDYSLFSKMLISETIDKMNLYKKAVKELNIDSRQVLVCGDRVELDLKPAHALGYKTVWLSNPRGGSPDFKADFEIEDIGAIKAIAKQMESKF